MRFFSLEGVVRFFKKKSFFYVFQIIFFGIAYLCIQNNVFSFLDVKTWEKFMDRRNEILQPEIQAQKSKITLIGIDEKFFTNEKVSIQGLHRGYYAKAIENINKFDPKVVGIDVFFEHRFQFKQDDERANILNKIFNTYDYQLANSLNPQNVISTIYDRSSNSLLIPDEIFFKNNPSVGHVNSFIDNSSINIGMPVMYEVNRNIYPLSIEVFLQKQLNEVKKILNNPGVLIEPIVNYGSNFLTLKVYKDEIKIPIIQQNSQKFIFTPIYVSSPNQIKYISFYDAYNGNINEDDIKDRIVYIGATDTTLNDIKLTLKGNIPGVLMHVNETISLLNNDFIYALNKEETNTLLFILIILNIVITMLIKRDKASTTIIYILVTEILLLIVLGFLLSTLKVPYSIFLPLGTLITLVSIHLIFNGGYIFVETFFLKEDIQRLFSLYVGENISNKKQSDLSKNESNHTLADEINAAIFFSDMANFTNISEKLSPIQNVKFINEYLDTMSQDIALNKGFIDKYIGDAIMAFWEEGDGPELAAKSAISNILSLPRINSRIHDKISQISEKAIDLRIGLNYGKVIVGDIGSEKYKLNYTIIGDNVNIASRLEGINKYYGTRICMTEYFYEQIKGNDDFIARKLDKIQVKGKDNAVIIYELFPIFKSLLTEEKISMTNVFIEHFEKGLEKYFEGNFSQAIEMFNQAQYFQIDNVCEVFIKRCNYLIENQPEDWKGIWKYEEK